MPGASLEAPEGVGRSRIITAGDAAKSVADMVLKFPAKPHGRKLRPLQRLCGCDSTEMTEVCAEKQGTGKHDNRETEGEYRARLADNRTIDVIVMCSPKEGFNFYGAAGRIWPAGETRAKVHADELAELRDEPGRISVLTLSEIRSKSYLPDDIADPVAYYEEQLRKAKAEREGKAAAPPPAEVTPEVAALPPAPKQDKGKK